MKNVVSSQRDFSDVMDTRVAKGDAFKKGESGGVRSREMKRNHLIVKTIYEKCCK